LLWCEQLFLVGRVTSFTSSAFGEDVARVCEERFVV
jgi:hypothetical protein